MGKTEWFDPLTQLHNRQSILDILHDLINGAQRYKQDLSVSLIDIDQFNIINERYGQFTGDIVLENVAKIVYRNVRASDMVGRYGGDQFLVILPRANLYSAMVSAERIRKTIQNAEMKDSADKTFHVTVSQGLSGLEQGDDERSLVARAEEALIKAKQNGHNKVEM